jgi:hypothetical protein
MQAKQYSPFDGPREVDPLELGLTLGVTPASVVKVGCAEVPLVDGVGGLTRAAGAEEFDCAAVPTVPDGVGTTCSAEVKPVPPARLPRVSLEASPADGKDLGTEIGKGIV